MTNAAYTNPSDNAVLRVLIEFLGHVSDFPIYLDGTKPGALQFFRWSEVISSDLTLNFCSPVGPLSSWWGWGVDSLYE